MAKAKLKLPKRIAGVKIPKKVRKGPVGQFLNSSAGQLLVAEALIAAGGAFVASTDRDESPEVSRSIKRLGQSAGDRTSDAQRALERGSARLAFAFSEAVRAFRIALTDGPQSATEGASVERRVGPEPAKKKPSPPEPGAPH